MCISDSRNSEKEAGLLAGTVGGDKRIEGLSRLKHFPILFDPSLPLSHVLLIYF